MGADADLQSHNYYPPRLRITNREQLLRAAGLSWFIACMLLRGGDIVATD